MKTSPAFPTDLVLLLTSVVAELTPVNTTEVVTIQGYFHVFNKFI